MIISHAHRYIFFAVPKTATHSVREALRLTKAENDWEQQVLFGEQAIPIAEIASIKHGHITARQIQPVLSPEQWQSYFKFGFVRNPYDRFVSICSFLNRHNPAYKDHELEWMKLAIKHQPFLERVLVRPQSEQLTLNDGSNALDYVGRYERLQESLDHILDKLELEKVELKVRNRSQHAGYKSYYDDELRSLVREFYRDDINRFEYQL